MSQQQKTRMDDMQTQLSREVFAQCCFIQVIHLLQETVASLGATESVSGETHSEARTHCETGIRLSLQLLTNIVGDERDFPCPCRYWQETRVGQGSGDNTARDLSRALQRVLSALKEHHKLDYCCCEGSGACLFCLSQEAIVCGEHNLRRYQHM